MATKVKNGETRPPVPASLEVDSKFLVRPKRLVGFCASCSDQSGCTICQVPSQRAKKETEIPE